MTYCWICSHCGERQETKGNTPPPEHCGDWMRRDWRSENVQPDHAATPSRKRHRKIKI